MSPSNSGGGPIFSNNKNHILHKVSKFDTLAGVAIKYGVEVADIKRLNGLATDFQMFALKTLLIPLPGRHPPSPTLSNGCASNGETSVNKRPPHRGQSNMLEPFQSLRLTSPQQTVSPAMSILQKYYGIQSSNTKAEVDGTEMAVYKIGNSDEADDEPLLKGSLISGSNHHHRSRDLTNGLFPENGSVVYTPLADARDGEGEKSNEKSVRRRQKADTDSRLGTPERLLKEENSGGRNGFSPLTGKSLAMRPKSASRTSLTTDIETGWSTSIVVGMGDAVITDGPAGVRKSSSTPSMQDPDNNGSSSVWSTSKWSLKPDLQAIPIPNPITGRKSKAALD
ncbi:hypothetical protein HS088_TW20G00765 [Tripterygium wilfordii]|uniref:LysM domain-containing protein n=1 Tax=Tripterygium wilfordii TaxID=458696 RepID=A0A7J7C8E6_TRIWF|nr:uncharacterized protein LOC119986411 isoform X1 [Tripterygium wilfordii]KAF5730392.1 hypothetical protein HS088_TW20G00765 [Tripterygium wilfordii]